MSIRLLGSRCLDSHYTDVSGETRNVMEAREHNEIQFFLALQWESLFVIADFPITPMYLPDVNWVMFVVVQSTFEYASRGGTRSVGDSGCGVSDKKTWSH